MDAFFFFFEKKNELCFVWKLMHNQDLQKIDVEKTVTSDMYII